MRAELLHDRRLRHRFFTRQGGASTGIYASRNCGFGSSDDPDRVADNRARSMEELDLPAAALHTVYQVHSADVAVVGESFAADTAPRVDAMVTNQTGIALGILTADCAPVLLADADAGVIAAAHAGWRGALAGVVDNVVAAMIELGASRAGISAAVGPCIAQASYQVGPEFRGAFVDADAANGTWFCEGNSDRWHFDLSGFVAERLRAAGVGAVARLEEDTCADADRFFSYRRSCLKGEPDYGRNLSAIALA